MGVIHRAHTVRGEPRKANREVATETHRRYGFVCLNAAVASSLRDVRCCPIFLKISDAACEQ